MEIEWDEAKDAANRSKHGISLAQAAHFDWAGAVDFVDTRKDYGEQRRAAFGMLNGRLHTCIFTLRDGAIRVISLRKANKREVRRYGKG